MQPQSTARQQNKTLCSFLLLSVLVTCVYLTLRKLPCKIILLQYGSLASSQIFFYGLLTGLQYFVTAGYNLSTQLHYGCVFTCFGNNSGRSQIWFHNGWDFLLSQTMYNDILRFLLVWIGVFSSTNGRCKCQIQVGIIAKMVIRLWSPKCSFCYSQPVHLPCSVKERRMSYSYRNIVTKTNYAKGK